MHKPCCTPRPRPHSASSAGRMAPITDAGGYACHSENGEISAPGVAREGRGQKGEERRGNGRVSRTVAHRYNGRVLPRERWFRSWRTESERGGLTSQIQRPALPPHRRFRLFPLCAQDTPQQAGAIRQQPQYQRPRRPHHHSHQKYRIFLHSLSPAR